MFAYLRYLTCLTLIAAIPGLSQAQTTLQAYEPFSYAVGGNLNTQQNQLDTTAPLGFTNNASKWVDNTQKAVVSTGSLTYLNMLSSGNSVNLSGAGFNVATRNLDSAPSTGGTSVFWLSFLIQRNQNTSINGFNPGEYAGISIGGDTNNTRTFIGAGPVGIPTSSNIQFTAGTNGDPGSDVSTGINVANSNQNPLTLIVAKVTLNTISPGVGSNIEVFLNPTTLGEGTGPTSATYSYANNSFVNGSQIAIEYGNLGNGASYAIDELRIGQTFIDVTPVPEPTTVVALSMMAIGGGTWLRKKKLQKSETESECEGQPALAI